MHTQPRRASLTPIPFLNISPHSHVVAARQLQIHNFNLDMRCSDGCLEQQRRTWDWGKGTRQDRAMMSSGNGSALTIEVVLIAYSVRKTAEDGWDSDRRLETLCGQFNILSVFGGGGGISKGEKGWNVLSNYPSSEMPLGRVRPGRGVVSAVRGNSESCGKRESEVGFVKQHTLIR
jgi:hypothetical protein